MPHDLTGSLGDQRQADVSALAERVHQAGLVVLAEGEPVDVPDGFVIGGDFRTDGDAHETFPPPARFKGCGPAGRSARPHDTRPTPKNPSPRGACAPRAP